LQPEGFFVYVLCRIERREEFSMGAFIVSFHAKAGDAGPVRNVLAADAERAWVAPPMNGWVSFYEEQADTQDSGRIEQLCERVSAATGSPVIAFLVHDSDFLCYWLFESGLKRDEYNSCPDYFGDPSDMLEPGDSVEEYLARLSGDADALLPLCRPGTSRSAIEKFLRVRPGEYTFAEEHLTNLVSVLGIDPQRAATTYRDIGLELPAEEAGVEFVGSGTSPEPGDDSWGRSFGTLAGDPGTEPAGQAPPGIGFGGGMPSLDALLAHAQDPNQKLMFAVLAKNAAAAREAIAAGADVNAAQGAAFMSAVATGSEELVRLLLENGVSQASASSALVGAVSTGNETLTRLLLERGADARQVAPVGWSLLHFAVQGRNPAIARLLLDAGVDPTARDSQGHTAADLAEAMIRQLESAAELATASGRPFPYGEQLLPGLRAVRDLLQGRS
jgi:hypothetical protein